MQHSRSLSLSLVFPLSRATSLSPLTVVLAISRDIPFFLFCFHRHPHHQHKFITTGNSTRQFTEITNTDIKYNVFKQTVTTVNQTISKIEAKANY